ncbi:unnamed protein product, partial [Symbiodinium pilosum]
EEPAHGAKNGGRGVRSAFSSKVSAAPQAPSADAKADAKAKVKAKAVKPKPDLLGALAAEETARAAAMLAKFAPVGGAPSPMPVPTPAPQRAVVETGPVPYRAPEAAPVAATSPAQPRTNGKATATAKIPASVAPQKTMRKPEVSDRSADDATLRAEAEAAAERAIEHDRSTHGEDWWKKLKAPKEAKPVQRVDRVPMYRSQSSNEAEQCQLPTRRFKVLAQVQPVRAQPCAGAPVCGGKKSGEILRAQEESFDGWVKLAGEAGWICQVDEELGASGKKCLEALEKPRAMAVESLSKTPGRQMLEVVADDGVDLLRDPYDGALLLGRRSFGEFLLADSQTYHGWVRLSDNDGWAQAVSGSGEKLLLGIRPDELQLTQSDGQAIPEEAQKEQLAAAAEEAARKEALRQLEAAALSGNSAFFCAALEVARQKGVSKKDIAKANAMRS